GQKVPVIISDYIMPGMKGDQLLKEIHKISPESLKILLTGQASIEGISNAINNAALYRYIAKPWDKDDLVLTVKEAIKSFLQELKIKEQNKELRILNTSLEEKVIKRTEELRLANAAKDKFFSIIAHDLKSPFNALLGMSDIMLNNWDALGDEEKIDFIKDIHSSSKSTFDLLQNLLEWSRAQTGRIKVEPSDFKPKLVVDLNIQLLSAHANTKDISLRNTTLVDDICFADMNMITTVFRNIISNSIKFTNIGGAIEISSAKKGNLIEYCIADNGIGMDEETLSGLFDISSKVQREGTSKETGTGLGLLLCKEFVEKNGGSIRVESQPDEGSKFFFTIPLSNN
ncbi:MAG: hybrid sensor histidine kinase/response regulator, partial [Draconibacterium sp.]|nr:hybrid sensor histidine kinase/response regulator [Draconibacterium sp.]